MACFLNVLNKTGNDIFKMMLSFFRIIIPAIVFLSVLGILIYLATWFFQKNKYVPCVIVSASTDNGNTYTENLKTLLFMENIYIKFEVTVKVVGVWRSFVKKELPFSIEYPNRIDMYTCEISDYINCHNSSCENQPNGPDGKIKNNFSLLASAVPVKSVIVIRLKKNGNNADSAEKSAHEFKVSFGNKIRRTYQTTRRVCFVNKPAIS